MDSAPQVASKNKILWEEVLEVRRALHEAGYHPIPASEKTKAPMFAGWPRFTYKPDDPEPVVPRTTNKDGHPTRMPHRGTSVATTGLVCVDFDLPDLVDRKKAQAAFLSVAMPEFEPPIRCRSNSGSAMIFFRAGEGMRDITASHACTGGKIEIDANHPGQQAYIHGMHPSGVALEWEGDPLWAYRIEELPELGRKAANDALAAALAAMGADGVDSETIGSAAPHVAPTESVAEKLVTDHIKAILTGEHLTPAMVPLVGLLIRTLNLSETQAAMITRALLRVSWMLNPGERDRVENAARQIEDVTRFQARCAAEDHPDAPKRQKEEIMRLAGVISAQSDLKFQEALIHAISDSLRDARPSTLQAIAAGALARLNPQTRKTAMKGLMKAFERLDHDEESQSKD